MSLSIVSDGTFDGSKILHKGRDISEGLSRCDIVMIPGEPVRAILTFEYVELGMSIEEPQGSALAPHPAVAAHRSLAGG